MRAAWTSLRLSLLFTLVYGGTNWLTAHRDSAAVATWFFSWELTHIPLIPVLIVPYMSIDLLFFLAPFLCTDERELRVFRQRVTFSILVAAVLFLLMPLRLAWPPRPGGEGLFADLVQLSGSVPFLMEYPHNLFPALHIALAMILAEVYARHTDGIVRALSYLWFVLIGLSTVLTWQHHLVDVAGGLVLGAFAFYVFRESPVRLDVLPNRRVGCYYAMGAALLTMLAPALRPWGIFLLWPAAGLGMVAAAYFGLGPGIFRKSRGRLPLSTRFVLAPILVGQFLSLRYYRRRCRAWDEVTPGLLVGRVLTEAESAQAIEQGVTAVLDLTGEFSETTQFRKLRYLNIPILDLTAPTPLQLHDAVAFISREINQGTVYLHCKIGFSRSATVAAAYLLASGAAATAEEAIQKLHTARPAIIIRPEASPALLTFQSSCPNSPSPFKLLATSGR
jgi:protein-tyrosine phosphatase/membrane-associated phospholipid phosphatase